MRPYEGFIERFHAHFTQNPNRRVVLGVERELGRLPDPSNDETARRLDEARQLSGELEQLSREDLSFDEQLDLDLARLMLEAEAHRDSYRFNDRTRLQQLPSAGDDIGDGVFMLFINDPRPAADRLLDITERLEQVPDYLQSLLARLDTPVERWVGMDVEKVEGLTQLFATAEDWANKESFKEAPRLSQARQRAESALADYVERLKQLPTTRQLHVGDALAREIVANRGIDKSLEELHRIAKDFLAETYNTLETLRARLAERYNQAPDTSIEQLEGYLNKRFAVELEGGRLESVLDRYQKERDRILSFIRERSLFPVFEDQDIRILRTPRFLEPSIPAGAMVSPAPFRDGTKRSLVYLTLSDELLDEHTELSIPSMMIHEGIPGHHLQLATAATHPSVVRRHFDAMDHAEGWTTMLEDYMLERRLHGRADR